MKEQKKFRVTIGTFDFIKGIGMFLIVLGHMAVDYNPEIYPSMYPLRAALHFLKLGVVPMFYIISGYYFKENKVGMVMKKSAKELLIPYAWVGVFVSILFPVFHYLSFRWMPGTIQETLKYILGFVFGIPESQTIFGIQVHGCNVVWFLLASFVAQNILNLIVKVKSQGLQIGLVLLCVLARNYLSAKGLSYFCLERGLFAVGYFYIGYFIKKRKILQKGLPIWGYGLLVAAWAFLCYWKGGAISYLASYPAGLFFFYLCIPSSKLEGKLPEAIRMVGMNTYWLMCIHSVEMCCIAWYSYVEKFQGPPILGFCIGLVIRGLILFVGYHVLNRVLKYLHERKVRKNA